MLRRWLSAVLVTALLATTTARAEVAQITITNQPGISYLPALIMEKQRLIEKEAERRGIPPIEVKWVTLSNGGAATDALLSGQVDFVTTGITNFILVWSATNGATKAVGALSRVPMFLVTRNPAIHDVADFGDQDRIAVPNTKASSQIILLQMLLEQRYGEAGIHRFDKLLVQLGHPEAVQALSNVKHEINSHLSAPPYQDQELKFPGVHKVLTLTDVMGGPATNTVAFSTEKFRTANPKAFEAFVSALDQANEFIGAHPREAAELYLAATREKTSPDEIVSFLLQPTTSFSTVPAGALRTAQFMAKVGVTKRSPADWRDLFFPNIHDRPGN
jgi:NitT/TauT family transport system substrate-binding protein